MERLFLAQKVIRKLVEHHHDKNSSVLDSIASKLENKKKSAGELSPEKSLRAQVNIH